MPDVDLFPWLGEHFPPPAPVTALVLARNDARLIEPCLFSLAWAAQILVADLGSQDDTAALARRYADAVLVMPPGPGDPREAALLEAARHASHEWLFWIEAGERVPPALAARVAAFVARPPATVGAVVPPAENLFLGRPIRHAGAPWPGYREPRLVSRRFLSRAGDPGKTDSLGTMPASDRGGAMLRQADASFSQFLSRLSRNAYAEAQDWLAQGRPFAAGEMLAEMQETLATYLGATEGWRDGAEGLLLALGASAQRYFTWAYLVERRQEAGMWQEAERALPEGPWSLPVLPAAVHPDGWREGDPIAPALALGRGSAETLPVVWEGPQFVYFSYAHINRELCHRLLAAGEVELSVLYDVMHDFGAFDPEGDPRWESIARVHHALERPAAVHVRCQWPPSFQPPPQGAWVMLQTWDFGGLPGNWVAPLRDQVDELWVLSGWARDCAVRSGVPAEKVVVVPAGVDLARFHPEGERYPLQTGKAFKFLFVGGTVPRKGIDLLLDAYLGAFTAADDVCLVIKGHPTGVAYAGTAEAERIQALAAAPGAAAIEYLDASLGDDQMASLYRACDVLVHPYRAESFGMIMIEAMACGLPVIATGYGGCLDYSDATTAWLLPAVEVPVDLVGVDLRIPGSAVSVPSTIGYWWAEPYPAALTAALRRAAARPEEGRAMGRRARARAEEYGWDAAAARVLARLRALAGRRPARLRGGGAA